MGQVRRYSRLYWLFLLQRLKILMEYRANFLIGASSTVSEQAAVTWPVATSSAAKSVVVPWRT